MTRNELAKELERLGDINSDAHPLAATVLLTLSGLITTGNEKLLALEADKINDLFIKQLKKLTQQ